jgi:hypothetical protein|tara:strand:+ start:285 stop:410 length:126 start_codon:yes stop_codon:yes gene_type:complete
MIEWAVEVAESIKRDLCLNISGIWHLMRLLDEFGMALDGFI